MACGLALVLWACPPSPAVPSARLRITLRSTGPSTASQLGPASASGLSCAGRAKPSRRCGPVSSNVMRCPSVLDAVRRNQPVRGPQTPCRTRPSAPRVQRASVTPCSLWAARSPLWHRPRASACSLRVAVGAQAIGQAGLRRAALVAPIFFASPTTATAQPVPWPSGPPPFLACRLARVQRAWFALARSAFGKAAHNPSLNRTLHGKPAWPGQRFGLILRRPGQAVSPLRAG